MRRKKYQIQAGALAAVWMIWAVSLCSWAAPEETSSDGDTFLEDMTSEEFMGGYSEEELEQALEEYFGSDWDASQLTGESELVEDAAWTMTWLENEKMFQYAFDENALFLSSVPQGMVCTGPVRIIRPESGVVLVYKDGEIEEDMGKNVFTEPGGYRLTITAYSMPDMPGEGMTFYKKDFYFRIIEPVSAYPSVLSAPEGFRFKEASLNGAPLENPHRKGIFLDQDGTYSLIWEALDSHGQIQMEMTLDTTAPFLIFSQDVTEGKAYVPLQFSISEKDAKVFIEYNGFQGRFTGDTLWAEGDCRLTVEDPAGNQRSYRLHLKPEQKGPSVHWIVMGFLVLAGTAAWLLYLRRHMKII